MYDMPDHRISVRIPEHLGQRLRRSSRLKGVPESELVREALDNYLAVTTRVKTAFDAAAELGVIGGVKGLPRDLSTNSKYMKGFGEDEEQ